MHEEPDSHSGVCPQKHLCALDKREHLRKGEPGSRLEGNGQAASFQWHEGWDRLWVTDLEILKNKFGSRGEEDDLQLLGR